MAGFVRVLLISEKTSGNPALGWPQPQTGVEIKSKSQEARTWHMGADNGRSKYTVDVSRGGWRHMKEGAFIEISGCFLAVLHASTGAGAPSSGFSTRAPAPGHMEANEKRRLHVGCKRKEKLVSFWWVERRKLP